MLHLSNLKSYASETSLTICGCATQGSPAFLFPPPGTPDACLATGPASPLQKRDQVFSQNIGSFKYTCTVDVYGNPNQIIQLLSDLLQRQKSSSFQILRTHTVGSQPHLSIDVYITS